MVYSEDGTAMVSQAAKLTVERSLSRVQASLNATQVTVREGDATAFQCNVKSDVRKLFFFNLEKDNCQFN